MLSLLFSLQDNKADLIINYYVDDILEKVMHILGIEIPTYCDADNPITRANAAIIDWTIDRRDLLQLEKTFKAKCRGVKKLRTLVKSKRKSTETKSVNGASDSSKLVKLEVKQENDVSEEVNSEPVEQSESS